jgi:hypothetical protein
VIGRQGGVALRRVSGVCVGDQQWIDLGLRSTYGTGRLETTDCQDLLLADQPIAGRHRFAVVHQWSIAHHDGTAVRGAHDHLECAARRPTDELADSSDVGSHGGDVVAHVVSYGEVDAQ